MRCVLCMLYFMYMYSGQLMAVKQLGVQEEQAQGHESSALSLQKALPLATILREVDIWQRLQHPNVVRCFGFGTSVFF